MKSSATSTSVSRGASRTPIIHTVDFRDGLPAWATYTGTDPSTYRLNGELLVAAAGTIRVNDYGIVIEGGRANKTLPLSNPTDLTGITSVGDSAAVLSMITDSTCIAEAGLSGILTNNNAVMLDNRLGTTPAYIQYTGLTGDTNVHTLSVYARGIGSIRLRTGYTNPPNSAVTVGSQYARYSVDTSVLNSGDYNAADVMRVQASAGTVLYAVLPSFEEGVGVTSVILNTTGATTSRKAESVYMSSSNMFGLYSGSLAFTAVTPAIGTYSRVLWQLSLSNDNTDRLIIYVTAAGYMVMQTSIDGTITNTTLGAVTGNTMVSVAANWSTRGFFAMLQGASEQSMTTLPNIANFDTLTIGCTATSGSFWNSTICSMAYSKDVVGLNHMLKAVAPTSYTHDYTVHKSHPPYATFSRSSSAWDIVSGRVVLYPAGQPAINANGFMQGSARTNLITYSNLLTDSSWTTNYSTVTADAAVSPLGDTSMACSIVEDDTTNVRENICSAVTTNGVNFACSIFAKVIPGSATRYLGFRGMGIGGNYPIFDLNTGVVARVGTTWNTARIVPLNDGWYWCVATGVSASSSSFRFTIMNGTDVTSGNTYLGDGVSGFYVWGAQYEEGVTSINSPIISEGSTTARLADVVTLNNTFLYDKAVGAFAGKIVPGYSTDVSQYLAVRRSAASTQRIVLYRQSGGAAAVYKTNNVDTVTTKSLGALTSGEEAVLAMNWYHNNIYAESVSGTVQTQAFTDSEYAYIDTMYLGSENGASPLGGYIKKVAFVRAPEDLTTLMARVT